MLISPAVIGLHLIAFLVASTLVGASCFAGRILYAWDMSSGSELQIRLERQTYLISTLVAFALGAEVLSLVLFVHTAERLSSQFVGAMCATGVLNVNAFGFPTLFLKIVVFFLATVWLTLNRVDAQGYDYPLVRVKCGLLLAIVPWTVGESIVQTRFFLDLRPEVITSCCGALFSPGGTGIAADLAGWSMRPALWAFYATGIGMLIVGWAFWRWPAGGLFFAAGSIGTFGVALVAILTFLSLYVYENPNHHCPFCLLKAGYNYVGYALYLPLFGATAAGLSAGVLAPLRQIPSLNAVIPREMRRLSRLTLLGFGIFYGLATALIGRSSLVLLE